MPTWRVRPLMFGAANVWNNMREHEQPDTRSVERFRRNCSLTLASPAFNRGIAIALIFDETRSLTEETIRLRENICRSNIRLLTRRLTNETGFRPRRSMNTSSAY